DELLTFQIQISSHRSLCSLLRYLVVRRSAFGGSRITNAPSRTPCHRPRDDDVSLLLSASWTNGQCRRPSIAVTLWPRSTIDPRLDPSEQSLVDNESANDVSVRKVLTLRHIRTERRSSGKA
ncbi:unnamed protein product, partial [Ectocarpus fasciculatus]